MHFLANCWKSRRKKFFFCIELLSFRVRNQLFFLYRYFDRSCISFLTRFVLSLKFYRKTVYLATLLEALKGCLEICEIEGREFGRQKKGKFIGSDRGKSHTGRPTLGNSQNSWFVIRKTSGMKFLATTKEMKKYQICVFSFFFHKSIYLKCHRVLQDVKEHRLFNEKRKRWQNYIVFFRYKLVTRFIYYTLELFISKKFFYHTLSLTYLTK